jgi:hypothetical protein
MEEMADSREVAGNIQSLRDDITNGINATVASIVSESVEKYRTRIKKERQEGN